MAGAQGVEPQPHEPESCVLPLDNAPSLVLSNGHNRFWGKRCQGQVAALGTNLNQASTQILCLFAIWD